VAHQHLRALTGIDQNELDGIPRSFNSSAYFHWISDLQISTVIMVLQRRCTYTIAISRPRAN